MVEYNPKAWFRITFSVRGTVLRRVSARLLEMAAITAALCLLDGYLREQQGTGLPAFNPIGHTVMGVAVGLLIVFRNNCSYDRFWEGRRLWGMIVNASRNLMRGAAVYVGAAPELARLIAAYAVAVKLHLRRQTDFRELERLAPADVLAQASVHANVPSALAYFLSAWIQERRSEGKLDPEQARTLETYVAQLLDCQGGCERIRLTPIPFAYAVHIKQFLLIYLVTLPFVVIPMMGWLAVPLVVVTTFGLYGIEEASVEIEDPFGADPNDLPLDQICATIERDAYALALLPLPTSEGLIAASR
jgi:ion channel-forming bestrophin family protein